MPELRTAAEWKQLVDEWKRSGERASALGGVATAALLHTPTFLAGALKAPPHIVERWPEYEGSVKEYGKGALGALAGGLEAGLREVPAGLGDVALETYRDLDRRLQAAEVSPIAAAAIDIITPGPPLGAATRGVKPMARGSGLRKAARPPGRADPQELARGRSNTLARYQPTAEPEEFMGGRTALNARSNVRQAETTEDAIEIARSGAHLKARPGDSGGFVGAPASVRSGGDIVDMRHTYDRLVDQGVEAGGESWYVRTQEGLREITGGQAGPMQRASRELAATSRQRTPQVNYAQQVQAHNLANLGREPVGLEARTAAGFVGEANDMPMSLGPKTQVYEGAIRGGSGTPVTGTNDVWQARAFGYVDNEAASVTDARHAFMDAEGMLAVERANARALGGRTDWTAPEVQAAAWVAINGRDTAIRFGWPVEQGLREAAKSYPDYFKKHTLYATHEATPGGVTGHMPGVAEGSYAGREAYGRPWTDEAGRDVLYEAAGLDLQLPATKGVGTFTPAGGGLEINPNVASRPQVGVVPRTKDRPRGLSDPEREAVQKVEAFRAVVDAQEAGAAHLTMPYGQGVQARELTGFELEHGRALTPDEMKSLAVTASKEGYGGKTGFVANTGERSILEGWAGAPTIASEKAIKEALETAGIPIDTLRRARHDTVFESFDEEWATGGGAVTRKLLEIMKGQDAPAVEAAIANSPKVEAAVLARLERDVALAAKNMPGFNANEAVNNFKRIWLEGKFEGLARALESGELLPAVFLPAVGLGVGMALLEGKGT
jgi:hypothetical protein